MPQIDVPLEKLRFGQTSRKDAWWLQSALTVAGLVLGFGYLTWAMFQPEHYWFGPYISPVASPEIFGNSPFSVFGPKPDWLPWPSFIPFLPGLLILWAPGGFRFTCYYYRGSYYKAFWADPPSCAVGEPRGSYRGENSFPLIIQNIHRYFLYIAIIFIFILGYDVCLATQFPGPGAPDADKTFGIGLGPLVMLTNLVLISCYTFSCHSFRHLIGGVLDVLSRSPGRKRVYDCVSCLNRRHGLWAWLSLASMCTTELYIRLCAMGVISDWRII
jgi:hypothetical protein